TQRSVLASGLKVALLPKGTRGAAVQAQLKLRYGDVASLQGLETVGVFAGSLFDKGGAGLSRQQIADGFDALRATVGFAADDQVLTVNVTTVREQLPAVIERIGALLRAPAFPADALDELRRQWLTSIERQRHEPGALVANQLQRHGNPYPRGDLRHAPSFDEMVQDVNAVTAAQLQAFHRRFYSAASAEFAAVGDLDAAAVKQALDKAFGDWRQPAAGALRYQRAPRPLVNVPPQRFVLNTPDKQNANLRAELGMAINDSHADYPALLMANYLFGLSESSRLWTRIREKDGLTYDVRSFMDWNRVEPASHWVVTASFAPQNRAKVEAALNEELQRALKDGFSAAELEASRAGLLNLLRLSRAQDGAVASQLTQYLDLGRSFAFAQKLDDALAALTPDQVSAALRKYVDPTRWSAAWGGDFKAP
ncbi:MAG: pitrilysin family protein, partial [Rubrivivax sp.]